MGHIYGVTRHDVRCFPERLDDSSAEDHPVRCLDACVDALALAASGFRRAIPAATGRPGSAPGELVTLDLSGDRYRLRARRRLAQEGQRKVAWLGRLKTRRPAHTTRANGRQTNLAPLRHVCRTFPRLGKQRHLLGAERVAMDGRTGRAVHAQARHFTQDKLTTRIVQREAPIAASLTELARRATEEERGTGGGAPAAALAAKSAARTQRQRRYAGLQAQRRSHRQAQRSRTDPERRAMHRGPGRGTAGCDTVQTAVDAKHTRMVACAGTNDPGDRTWRSPMALHAKAVRAGRCDAGADMGYDHGHEGKACLEAGSTPSVARPLPSAHEQRGLCSKEDFP